MPSVSKRQARFTPADLESIAAEPYEHRGILHSEMALIIATCRKLGIEVVLESGRARAQSTYLLAKYLPECEIHSGELRQDKDEEFGRQRVAIWPNVVLYSGDGSILLPKLAKAMAGQRTAVLCDGPKGAAAVAVIKACFRFPHVLVGFVHDMRKLDHGLPSQHRAVALETFPSAKFSDDERLVTGASWMDASVIAAGGRCGEAHEAEFGSYGPTVGVFLNSKLQQSED